MNRTLVEYREARAVELSLDGLTFDQIAHELGYANRSGAWKAARRCLARRRDLAASAYIELTLLDLQALQEKVWPAAMRGDLGAAEVALRAMQDRRHLVEFLSGPETPGRKPPRAKANATAAPGADKPRPVPGLDHLTQAKNKEVAQWHQPQ